MPDVGRCEIRVPKITLLRNNQSYFGAFYQPIVFAIIHFHHTYAIQDKQSHKTQIRMISLLYLCAGRSHRAMHFAGEIERSAVERKNTRNLKYTHQQTTRHTITDCSNRFSCRARMCGRREILRIHVVWLWLAREERQRNK